VPDPDTTRNEVKIQANTRPRGCLTARTQLSVGIIGDSERDANRPDGFPAADG